jgi:N-acetylglutamate synthase-like GNAT family acetyltransferase
MRDDYAAYIADGRVHVLEQDGEIIGLVVLIPQAQAMLLDNVAVSPRAQGRGFGVKLPSPRPVPGKPALAPFGSIPRTS